MCQPTAAILGMTLFEPKLALQPLPYGISFSHTYLKFHDSLPLLALQLQLHL